MACTPLVVAPLVVVFLTGWFAEGLAAVSIK
jgi:hypothetical protein